MPNGRWPYNNLPFMQSGNTAKRSGWRRYRKESGKQIADRFVSSFWMCVNLWGRRSGQGKARRICLPKQKPIKTTLSGSERRRAERREWSAGGEQCEKESGQR